MAAMVDAEALVAKLRAERSRLLLEIEELKGAEQSDGRPEGSPGSGNHMADDASETVEHERNQALMGNLQRLLRMVNHALHKVDEGTYGLCDSCGAPIADDRLQALPHATLCIRCKAREEKGR